MSNTSDTKLTRSNLDNFTQQDHRCRTEWDFPIFIFTQVDQYSMGAIYQNPMKAKHVWYCQMVGQ